MKYILRYCVALGCGFGIFVTPGCDRPSIPTSNATANALLSKPASHEDIRLLHVFENRPDGANPAAGLAQFNGNLYGTTTDGGASDDGTIYVMTVTGKEHVLHSFSGSDGSHPTGELLPFNGAFYGTTSSGGAYGKGTLFFADKLGNVVVFINFPTSGGNPAAGLVDINETIFGTTPNGGASGKGTVFALDTDNGASRTVYSFGKTTSDGATPSGTLVVLKNKLYGTTRSGGAYGGGTIFSLTPKGKETVLYSFGNGTDGKDPDMSTLTLFKGNLYGTTALGGTHGRGEVFRVYPSDVVRSIYNFGDHATDGSAPIAGVVAYDNALYGTTSLGGANNLGTIYRVTSDGNETALYAFSSTDGTDSLSRLLPEGTNLYGTLSVGGSHGVGTAFRFAP